MKTEIFHHNVSMDEGNLGLSCRSSVCFHHTPFHQIKKLSVKTAFTLIELLVVIAIISLLVSILLPSLTKARELAQMAVCATNARSIGQGFYFFADEHDGKLPTMYVPINDPNLNSYIVALWPYMYSGENPFSSGDPGFYDRITKSIFRCPTNPARQDTQAGYASFAASMHLSECSLEQITNPGAKLLLADGGSDMTDDCTWGNVVFVWLTSSGYPINITYRHDNLANAVYVDGHVSTIDIFERYGLYPGNLLP